MRGRHRGCEEAHVVSRSSFPSPHTAFPPRTRLISPQSFMPIARTCVFSCRDLRYSRPKSFSSSHLRAIQSLRLHPAPTGFSPSTWSLDDTIAPLVSFCTSPFLFPRLEQYSLLSLPLTVWFCTCSKSDVLDTLDSTRCPLSCAYRKLVPQPSDCITSGCATREEACNAVNKLTPLFT